LLFLLFVTAEIQLLGAFETAFAVDGGVNFVVRKNGANILDAPIPGVSRCWVSAAGGYRFRICAEFLRASGGAVD